MPADPLLVFALRYSNEGRTCIAQELIQKAEQLCNMGSLVGCKLGESGRELLRPVLAAKLLYASNHEDNLEVWLRVSGEPQALQALETVMKREKGVSFQIVSENKYSIIVRLILSKDRWCSNCQWCPLARAPPGSMVKSVLMTSDFMLVELVVAKTQALKALESRGFEIVYSARVEEVDFALTAKQELALVLAYLYGYYSHPRKISIKELAAKLRISSSALAELLRKAELKVITRYVMEELPHYLIHQVMYAIPVPREGRSGKTQS
ncbi:putative DNA binding protein [Pyrodictium delaneyi]|uniref:Putative DNA binding protein n=1 Tax=Pyrodictium delaneyi TaxID=1273541 RepID=A0A0P0N376_9CREN|nr:helix-turn-helix domain-containing protein [Pyrodictium delaneyi]ALL00814.1 putative DNA binding protein [Pyrodictium delaneyi]OWJ55552.1 hypothetical protein Pdsh_01825 [Pyrodictium delaneyi]